MGHNKHEYEQTRIEHTKRQREGDYIDTGGLGGGVCCLGHNSLPPADFRLLYFVTRVQLFVSTNTTPTRILEMAEAFKDTVLAGEIAENLKRALSLGTGDEVKVDKQKQVFSLVDGQPIRFVDQGDYFELFLYD